MENNNNIVGEGDVDFDFVQQRADADVDAENRRLLKLISMLQSRDEFHICKRNKINELVENFLYQAEEDFHTFLCDNKQHENYRGLDCDRDTEDEVEAAIRFFPNILSRRGGEFHEYPIQHLTYAFKTVHRLTNLKAVSFIPLLVKLAIELGQFDEEDERGGLLIEDNNGFFNVIQSLVSNAYHEREYDTEHHEIADNRYLNVLIKLRNMGHLKKEDIINHVLLSRLCAQPIFAEKRFLL